MDPPSNYITLSDLNSDENSRLKEKRKKNWYVNENKINDVPRRTMKPKKNLTSNSTRIACHKNIDETIPTYELINAAMNYEPNAVTSKQTNPQRYLTKAKNKLMDSSRKSIRSASYTSSLSSDSSRTTIIADKKVIKISSSSFNMRHLASQINKAGQKLIQLAASLEAGKIDECHLNFDEERTGKTKNKNYYTHKEKEEEDPRNNKKKVDKSRLIEPFNPCQDVDHNCCSMQQYSSHRYKPTSMQSRGNKSKKKPRLDEESNHTGRKNDSFNSIHSVDGHSRRQHRNEVHSFLDGSITPSTVLNGFHPEKCDTRNIRMNAYDGVMSGGLNRKKKLNKNSRMRKMDWKLNDLDYLDENNY